MTHSSTELLIDYWQGRSVNGQAPARAAIDPTDFPTLLPQVFMLGRRGPADYVFRLAGGLIRDLHRMDLRGAAFTHLWQQDARLPLQMALEEARRTVSPLRLTARAHAGPNTLGVNMALMPLSNPEGQVDRFLGVYEPLDPIREIAGEPIHRLQLVALGANTIMPGSANANGPRLTVVGGLKAG